MRTTAAYPRGAPHHDKELGMAWTEWEPWEPSKEAVDKGLAFDPLVTNIAPDPTEVPALFVMQGFLGPSPTPGVWRLYQNHALDEYFDIDERYIQACAPHPDEGVRLWILRGSPMDHVVKRATPAEVDYLSGPIADQAVRRAEAGAPAEALDPAKVTACPPCPSRSP